MAVPEHTAKRRHAYGCVQEGWIPFPAMAAPKRAAEDQHAHGCDPGAIKMLLGQQGAIAAQQEDYVYKEGIRREIGSLSCSQQSIYKSFIVWAIRVKTLTIITYSL